MKKSLIEGSSKIFHKEGEQLLMVFKDTIHGAQREGNIGGTGHLRKAFTYHFYRFLQQRGIKTHLDESMGSALADDGIFVCRLNPVKIEIIVRNVARGYWVDDHKVPLFEGGVVFDEPIVEFCLKWKTEQEDGTVIDDPRISPPVAVALHKYGKDPVIKENMIINVEEAKVLEKLALDINEAYQLLLKEQGWILEDFKFEVGVGEKGRDFVLIDEISPDCSRIRDKEGNSLTKDLFRQRRPSEEIYEGYRKLKEAAEQLANQELPHV